MTAGRRRQLASMGGKKAHATGTAHQFTTAEAQAAGRKGGEATAARKRARVAVADAAAKAMALANHTPVLPLIEDGDGEP